MNVLPLPVWPYCTTIRDAVRQAVALSRGDGREERPALAAQSDFDFTSAHRKDRRVDAREHCIDGVVREGREYDVLTAAVVEDAVERELVAAVLTEYVDGVACAVVRWHIQQDRRAVDQWQSQRTHDVFVLLMTSELAAGRSDHDTSPRAASTVNKPDGCERREVSTSIDGEAGHTVKKRPTPLLTFGLGRIRQNTLMRRKPLSSYDGVVGAAASTVDSGQESAIAKRRWAPLLRCHSHRNPPPHHRLRARCVV